jgi:glycosyltransferase involved in cell wall biosynthesis
MFLDNSKNNYKRKKNLFTKINEMTIVSPSNWLSDFVKESFLMQKHILTINNGTDLNVFKPINNNLKSKLGLKNEKIIIGVASVWTQAKGLHDFIKLNELLSEEYKIILVGLNKKQKESLPANIIGIERTESVHELAELYSMADVFVNPTYSDNFPTTNIEALACGTPVITYKTGGSPETVDEKTGVVVEQGNINKLKEAIELVAKNKGEYSENCRERAVNLYNKQDRFNDYIKLFNSLTE